MNNYDKIKQEILEIFFTELSKDLVKISDIIANNDPVALARELHKTKGACRFVGADAIEQIIKEFEEALKLGQTKKFNALLVKLEEACKSSRTTMGKNLQ